MYRVTHKKWNILFSFDDMFQAANLVLIAGKNAIDLRVNFFTGQWLREGGHAGSQLSADHDGAQYVC